MILLAVVCCLVFYLSAKKSVTASEQHCSDVRPTPEKKQLDDSMVQSDFETEVSGALDDAEKISESKQSESDDKTATNEVETTLVEEPLVTGSPTAPKETPQEAEHPDIQVPEQEKETPIE
ncbi:hypothetical protein WICPIJ_004759 [Wickerhamomyces pijperi]|uniref:Secreted protein n=1 Tax=Wickerhamomyces pijperi TaxID=599730 RepID=A0A9P8Q7I5_WICPI|nr:hypothetical protein WICPIJ_004759 [Wickerhamomyces pijperi]